MHARKLPRISESSFEPNRWMTSLCNGTSASTSKVIKNHMDSEPSIDYGNDTSASTSKVTYEPHYRRRVSSSERGTNMLLNKLEIIHQMEMDIETVNFILREQKLKKEKKKKI